MPRYGREGRHGWWRLRIRRRLRWRRLRSGRPSDKTETDIERKSTDAHYHLSFLERSAHQQYGNRSACASAPANCSRSSLTSDSIVPN